MAIFWQGKPRKKPNPEIREPRRQPSTFNSPVLHRLVACCPNGTERGAATRSSPEYRTGAGNSWVFGLLNVLRLTEPRSAAAEIDLGNTPLDEGGSTLNQLPQRARRETMA